MSHEYIRNPIILLHNTRCSKARAYLKVVKEKSIYIKRFHSLNEELSVSILNQTIYNLVDRLKDLIRTNEKDFKKKYINLKNKRQMINFLNKYPICKQRLLFFDSHKFKIYRPPETILKLYNYL